MATTGLTKIASARQAIGDIPHGASVMVGGFGLAGTPMGLIDALVASGTGGLTVISNNLGEQGQGLGALLLRGQVQRAIGSFFTNNPDVSRFRAAGRLEIQLLPQGTLAEAIRAGGAGIPAFYTPTGAGTLLSEGKEVREFGGRQYVLELALRADIALIRAHRADEAGNLTYRKSARNFNPLMATAAEIVIAEVDEVVPIGSLDPEEIVTPHLFVTTIVEAVDVVS